MYILKSEVKTYRTVLNNLSLCSFLFWIYFIILFFLHDRTAQQITKNEDNDHYHDHDDDDAVYDDDMEDVVDHDDHDGDHDVIMMIIMIMIKMTIIRLTFYLSITMLD